ncbi:MAG TPA: LptE family protein [Candidatus Eisenbacteria bacterium]|jgi:outer membrane lipopolysaccharide assembly protein LptE/RlpB|nr:LptE family protein [Candidatus Eisenbacteria bacterium]
MWGRTLAGALAAALLATGGCAYTVSGVLPGHLKTLAVPVFGNNTVEFRLADDVTQAITEAFLADRRLKLVRERDADAVLRGTVVSYRNQVYGYTTEERATQYEIVLVVQLAFRDQVKNRVLWKEDQLAVRTTYNVVPVGGEAARTETEGRAEVIQKLADQIVSRTVQGW